MTNYKVVPTDDAGFYRVDGLHQKLLKNLLVTFNVDIQPTDTDVDKLDKMTQAVYEVRHQNTHAVSDGDTFETPFGNLVVRGNLVVVDDANGTVAAAAQAGVNVSTKGQTLAQVCQANGITVPTNFPQTLLTTPVDQIPWGTISMPPHLKNLFAPPAQLPTQGQTAAGAPGPMMPGSPGIGKSSFPSGLPPQVAQAAQAVGLSLSNLGGVASSLQAVAYDQNGGNFQAQLQLGAGFTNQDIVDEFDNTIQHAFGNGNLRSVITYPGSTSRRVLEVGYHSDTFRIVIEIA